MANEHDDAIEKVLGAMKNASPPQGMEARIAQRLHTEAQAPAAAPRWRDLFAATTPSAVWWRGALTGAATALLAICAVLLVQHEMQSRHPQIAKDRVVSNTAPQIIAVKTSTPETTAELCPSQNTARPRSATPEQKVRVLRVEQEHPAHPILNGPLTAQERALIQLTRTASPQQLAQLASESQAKLRADDAAEFEKFFTPPEPPKAPAQNE